MSQTKEGGRKAAATNRAIHGEDFYQRIGALGGAAGKTGGFEYLVRKGQHERLAEISRKGGSMSRRRKRNG